MQTGCGLTSSCIPLAVQPIRGVQAAAAKGRHFEGDFLRLELAPLFHAFQTEPCRSFGKQMRQRGRK